MTALHRSAVWDEDDLALDLCVFEQFMGTDDVLQWEARSDDRFDLALGEQIKQGGKVFPKPLRVLLLDSGDVVKCGFLAVWHGIPPPQPKIHSPPAHHPASPLPAS